MTTAQSQLHDYAQFQLHREVYHLLKRPTKDMSMVGMILSNEGG